MKIIKQVHAHKFVFKSLLVSLDWDYLSGHWIHRCHRNVLHMVFKNMFCYVTLQTHKTCIEVQSGKATCILILCDLPYYIWRCKWRCRFKIRKGRIHFKVHLIIKLSHNVTSTNSQFPFKGRSWDEYSWASVHGRETENVRLLSFWVSNCFMRR